MIVNPNYNKIFYKNLVENLVDSYKMTKKLNSFTISEEIIAKMENKMRESQLKMLETGFSLCKEKNKNDLKVGNECEGTKCQIERPTQKCKGNEEYKGLYHTHPSGTTKPSIADLAGMYTDGLGCVGSVKENRIKCYVRKDPNIVKDTLGRLNYAYFLLDDLRYSLPSEDFEKLNTAAVNKFTENFNVVDLK